MAVVQISQIQIRRGFLQDLGQLAGGEFGWAVDKLRLFIGNGTISEGSPYEGSTEIITSNTDILAVLGNFNYKGLLGGYKVITGSSSISPTLRTYQDKIDDFVNIRDFGAIGDGVTDDSHAIQRAIDEIYGRKEIFTPVIARRTIRFHPGTYIVTRDILVPPYCSLKNSGKDSVIIKQTGTNSNCVIRTSNSKGEYLNLDGTGQIGPVEISGISFTTDIDNIALLILDSANDLSFHRCKFFGSSVNSNLLLPNNSRILRLENNYGTLKNVYFNECDFANASTLVELTNTNLINNIQFDKSTFSHAFHGIKTNSNAKIVSGLRITNSVFANIAQQALVTDSNIDGVVSAFNTFTNVGQNYQINSSPITPVLEFFGNVNYSFADIFTRSEEQISNVPNIKHHNKSNFSTDITSAIRYGNSFQTIGKTKILKDSSANFILLPDNLKQGFIDYMVERGTSIRSGKINYNFKNNLDVEFHESFTEVGNSGLTINIEYRTFDGNSKPYIICVNDSAGYQSAFTYDVKSLSNIN